MNTESSAERMHLRWRHLPFFFSSHFVACQVESWNVVCFFPSNLILVQNVCGHPPKMATKCILYMCMCV